MKPCFFLHIGQVISWRITPSTDRGRPGSNGRKTFVVRSWTAKIMDPTSLLVARTLMVIAGGKWIDLRKKKPSPAIG